jgi:hypothetical protein
MSNIIQERYIPVPLAANAVYNFSAGSPSGVAGFLAVTAGTITVTRSDGTVVLNAIPIAAGTYTPMPFYVGSGAVVTLAGGASGTLAVS